MHFGNMKKIKNVVLYINKVLKYTPRIYRIDCKNELLNKILAISINLMCYYPSFQQCILTSRHLLL